MDLKTLKTATLAKDRIVIKKIVQKTKDGYVVPEEASNFHVGEVVNVSPIGDIRIGQEKIKIGERVLYDPYMGKAISINKELYSILKLEAIAAKI